MTPHFVIKAACRGYWLAWNLRNETTVLVLVMYFINSFTTMRVWEGMKNSRLVGCPYSTNSTEKLPSTSTQLTYKHHHNGEPFALPRA